MAEQLTYSDVDALVAAAQATVQCPDGTGQTISTPALGAATAALDLGIALKKCLDALSTQSTTPRMTLNGYQLRAALEFVAPDNDADQFETEVTFGRSGSEDYCWLTEYPEEGSILLSPDPDCSKPAAAPLTPETNVSAPQHISTAPGNGVFLVNLQLCPELWWPAYRSDGGPIYSNAHGLLNEPSKGHITIATHWLPMPGKPDAATALRPLA